MTPKNTWPFINLLAVSLSIGAELGAHKGGSERLEVSKTSHSIDSVQTRPSFREESGIKLGRFPGATEERQSLHPFGSRVKNSSSLVPQIKGPEASQINPKPLILSSSTHPQSSPLPPALTSQEPTSLQSTADVQLGASAQSQVPANQTAVVQDVEDFLNSDLEVSSSSGNSFSQFVQTGGGDTDYSGISEGGVQVVPLTQSQIKASKALPQVVDNLEQVPNNNFVQTVQQDDSESGEGIVFTSELSGPLQQNEETIANDISMGVNPLSYSEQLDMPTTPSF